jgi:type III pantothenate kinase
MTAAFEKMVLNRMSHIGESFILKPYELPFIKIKYDSPRSVGADRICNAVAGYERFGGPLIIVDFGTATTFDVIEDDGAYKGGIICPGIETSSAELVRKAAKLTKVDFEFPDNIIGESTEKSLQSGIMYGELEMIDGLNRRIWKELGTECKVIATGGLAPVIAVRSETITEIVPFLVLDGLNRIYRKMQK